MSGAVAGLRRAQASAAAMSPGGRSLPSGGRLRPVPLGGARHPLGVLAHPQGLGDVEGDPEPAERRLEGGRVGHAGALVGVEEDVVALCQALRRRRAAGKRAPETGTSCFSSSSGALDLPAAVLGGDRGRAR